MRLDWRNQRPAHGGTPINTSITTDEAAHLRKLAQGKECLEIGAAYGYSAIVMALGGAARVTSIDPHAWLNSYGTFVANLSLYGVLNQVRIFREGAESAVPHLARLGEQFDLIFIDGDHSAEAVERDVKLALTVLRPDGTLACHDLGEDTCPGVQQALARYRDPDEHIDTLAVYHNAGKGIDR